MSDLRLDPGSLAIELLVAVRADDVATVERVSAALAGISDAELQEGLTDDAAKLAFWIDVYNAAVQQQSLDEVRTWQGRQRLFRRPVVTVAGRSLSLDAIEHGILRRSRWKLGLGYGTNPRPGRFEHVHRVANVDARLHFALNCGATSCPPIAAYQGTRIDAQLDLATRGSLAASVTREDRTLRLPTVMLWFIGDFGGLRGIRRFLTRHEIENEGHRLRFQRYDWSPAPNNWAPED